MTPCGATGSTATGRVVRGAALPRRDRRGRPGLRRGHAARAGRPLTVPGGGRHRDRPNRRRRRSRRHGEHRGTDPPPSRATRTCASGSPSSPAPTTRCTTPASATTGNGGDGTVVGGIEDFGATPALLAETSGGSGNDRARRAAPARWRSPAPTRCSSRSPVSGPSHPGWRCADPPRPARRIAPLPGPVPVRFPRTGTGPVIRAECRESTPTVGEAPFVRGLASADVNGALTRDANAGRAPVFPGPSGGARDHYCGFGSGVLARRATVSMASRCAVTRPPWSSTRWRMRAMSSARAFSGNSLTPDCVERLVA